MEETKEEMGPLQDQGFAHRKELWRLTFPHMTNAWPAETLCMTALWVVNILMLSQTACSS